MRAGVLAATAVATAIAYRKLNRVSSGGAAIEDLEPLVSAATTEPTPTDQHRLTRLRRVCR